MAYGTGAEIQVLDATQIGRGHSVAVRIDSFAVGVNAAPRAEPMLDEVLVERVGAGSGFWSLQLETRPRNKP
jgi:hypothetical protein